MAPSYALKLARAFDHLHGLDHAVQRWLDSDAYRIVREHDRETRKTAYVARISSPPPAELSLMVGDAAHNLRTVLDHLALALNAKGYADGHGGAELPPHDMRQSQFPIIGDDKKDPDKRFADLCRGRLKHAPAGAVELIERLQPYKDRRGSRSNALWLVDELDRIDKHRQLLLVAGAVLDSTVDGVIPAGNTGDLQLGWAGGQVQDGTELSWWHLPEGAGELDMDLHFTRAVAFGEGTPLVGRPIVPVLRDLRLFIRDRVALPLARFL